MDYPYINGLPTLDDLYWVVAGFRDARIVSLCGGVLLVWEFLLTFDRELEHFWCRPFSRSKALFFANRYGSLILVVLQNTALFSPSPSGRFCTGVYTSVLYGTFVTLTFAQVVLTVRILALYQSHRLLKIVLYILFLATWGSSLGLMISVQIAMYPITNPLVSLVTVGCVFQGVDSQTIYKLYIPFLIFQTILFIMTAYKGIRSFHGEQTSDIVRLLVRDGTVFYFVIFVATGFTVLGTLLRQTEIPASLANIILPAISLPTTRLILNLRSSHLNVPSPTVMARRPVYGVNSLMYNGRAGLAMEMSHVYQGRDGVRVKEVGRTTFVEVEMDITQSEDEHQHQTRVALWSTMGKWEDVGSSTPTFAPQVGSGIEETRWKNMESTPSVQTLDCISSTGDTRSQSLGVYEQPATTPTTGTGLIFRPRNPNGATQVGPRTMSDATNVSGSMVVGSGSLTSGEVGDTLARAGSRDSRLDLVDEKSQWRASPAHLM